MLTSQRMNNEWVNLLIWHDSKKDLSELQAVINTLYVEENKYILALQES